MEITGYYLVVLSGHDKGRSAAALHFRRRISQASAELPPINLSHSNHEARPTPPRYHFQGLNPATTVIPCRAGPKPMQQRRPSGARKERGPSYRIVGLLLSCRLVELYIIERDATCQTRASVEGLTVRFLRKKLFMRTHPMLRSMIFT